jgi:hypothetical protein
MPARMAVGIWTLTGSGRVVDGGGATVWTPSLRSYGIVEKEGWNEATTVYIVFG